MSDKLIKALAKDGQIRIIAAETTELVAEGVKRHQCAPTASAALGRMLTAGSIMGAMLKSEQDVLTIKMDGGGPAEGVVVTSYSDARVKGYIGNPNVDLPANIKGKLDVSGAIGKDGGLIIIRDMGLKEPYVGQSPIVSGEIGDDLAYYYTVSEQTPSAVGLGVLVGKELNVIVAGGIIIQMLPDADEMLADIVMYRLQDLGSITGFLKEKSIYDMLNFLFDDMGLKIVEEIVPEFKCDCSREKVEKALISIGKAELMEIYDEGKEEEIKCHFCNESYIFNQEDIGILLKQR
ncbi:Hsp33 family molecular chaperone HslO [Clostridium grantii]|uniref:33 kDa chaperonin n=1 Tax=Clostridium grantii DSM 8605 TaxID=1121316 RepID=A0A1M5Y0X6_9CLOT|nr:Hsp33 family molecular chaperone HslO [Clostridium grantii]SHI05642.1 molecular chaperone Hsp33 [Clostridium grantii DSM 8605]